MTHLQSWVHDMQQWFGAMWDWASEQGTAVAYALAVAGSLVTALAVAILLAIALVVIAAALQSVWWFVVHVYRLVRRLVVHPHAVAGPHTESGPMPGVKDRTAG